MISRILVSLTASALAGFLLLVLIGLWDGYERETKALGFSGIYERYLASQAGFADDPKHDSDLAGLPLNNRQWRAHALSFGYRPGRAARMCNPISGLNESLWCNRQLPGHSRPLCDSDCPG
jgi:hypothetical protein